MTVTVSNPTHRTAEEIGRTTAGPRPLPPLGSTREVPLPEVLDVTLATGLRVLVARNPRVPMAELRLRVPFGPDAAETGGPDSDRAVSRHLAAAELLTATLLTGTATRDRVAIDDEGYEATWAKALAVMLTAHPRIIRAALPHLRRSKCPRIVNIASTEALGATALHSPYSAAKAGVVGLTRSLAVELGRDGITVNCICPGPITTGMTARITDEHKAIYARRRTALGRYGDPEEVAHMTLSLCLPAASFLTGAIIPVDGGLMARNA